MQITIEAFAENKKIPEWGVMEFHGTFSTRSDKEIHEQYIGDLCYNKHGTPHFITGHLILLGEEKKLPHGLAVLEKVFDKDANQTKYIVHAVVKKKVVFETRPNPIMNNQPDTTD